MLDFVLTQHWRLALQALLLFVAGLLLAWPVLRFRLRLVARPAEFVLRIVLRLMGRSPPVPRVAVVIFAYNATVIFLYMAAGFHPLAPKVLCVWVGLNVAVLMGMVQTQEEMLAAFQVEPGMWRPASGLALICGVLVLVLELPCLWFAVGMGIRMGQLVQGGHVGYLEALAERARAYWTVIAPVLFVSATAEAIAIRGAGPPAREAGERPHPAGEEEPESEGDAGAEAQ
jgi:hypothetical protein